MKKILLVSVALGVLSGCQMMENKTLPEKQNNCNYVFIQGEEFELPVLNIKAGETEYPYIYVDKTLASANLSAAYQGVKGKYTGKEIDDSSSSLQRFCHPTTKLYGTNSFNSGWEECQNKEFYYSVKLADQTINKNYHEGVLFKQAILENCEVVYVQSNSKSGQDKASKELETEKPRQYWIQKKE